MAKISIIVPIHNSEEYLDKCVVSLLNQTMEEIEIILVDDFSHDSSPSLIADYHTQHPDRIKPLYLTENVRQGGARNRGLAIASGEYIAFVDSDDFIEPKMCEQLYNAACGADMVGANYFIDDGITLKNVYPTFGTGTKLTDERKVLFAANSGYFWSRIYRAEFLREYDLKFPENTFYEDAYFNFMTILYARSLVYVKDSFYHYVQRTDSTIHLKNKPHQYERIAIPSLIMESCKRRGIYEKYKPLIDYKYILMQMSNNLYTCLGQFDVPDVTQLQRISDAVRNECPDFKKNPLYKAVSLQLRTYFRLTQIHPRLAIFAKKHEQITDLIILLIGKLVIK